VVALVLVVVDLAVAFAVLVVLGCMVAVAVALPPEALVVVLALLMEPLAAASAAASGLPMEPLAVAVGLLLLLDCLWLVPSLVVLGFVPLPSLPRPMPLQSLHWQLLPFRCPHGSRLPNLGSGCTTTVSSST